MSDESTLSERDQNRAQLIEFISAWSEEHYGAEWAVGVEEEIRRYGGPWLVLAFGCDGWPLGYQARDGWDPLTDDERSRAKTFLFLQHYGIGAKPFRSVLTPPKEQT